MEDGQDKSQCNIEYIRIFLVNMVKHELFTVIILKQIYINLYITNFNQYKKNIYDYIVFLILALYI